MGTKAKWKSGKLTFYNDAVVDGTVESIDATTALLGYGLSIIGTTADQSYSLGPPVLGVTKDIMVGIGKGSSFVASIVLTSGNTLVTPSTIKSKHTFTLTPGASIPAYVQLRGVSTAAWALTSFNTTGKGAISFTSAVST